MGSTRSEDEDNVLASDTASVLIVTVDGENGVSGGKKVADIRTCFSRPRSIWSKLTKKAGPSKDNDKQTQQPNMALTRQRLITLVFGEMETIKMLPPSFEALEEMARDWVKPPPGVPFTLRMPVEHASLAVMRAVNGPYVYLTSNDSYEIAVMGAPAPRVEICSDAPPPPDETVPPPPPVLEMDGIFNLELEKGRMVGIDVSINSDELDMARMEDGTVVDGVFWGKLDIVHDGDTHKMEFSGTRLKDMLPNSDILVDHRALTKLSTTVAKPATAKCNLSILAPAQQYCEVNVTFSPAWKIGFTWPPAENMMEDRFKFFLRVHPGGALEHFESESVVTGLYYEAVPDSSKFDPASLVAPSNSFCMSTQEFLTHLYKVLDHLGLTLHARTSFLSSNMAAFTQHRNIAYRFMSPGRLARAIDISVTHDPCVWTRIFLLFRGIPDEELDDFAEAGIKEAEHNEWRETVGWSEAMKDKDQFRVLEISILECS